MLNTQIDMDTSYSFKDEVIVCQTVVVPPLSTSNSDMNSLLSTIMSKTPCTYHQSRKLNSNENDRILRDEQLVPFNGGQLDLARFDLQLLNEVRKRRSYSHDWDGNGSVVLNKNTVDEAEKFIRNHFTNLKLVKPSVSLSSDGELCFYWNTSKIVLDLGFIGDGTFSYGGIINNSKKIFSDGTSFDSLLPDDILDLLKV